MSRIQSQLQVAAAGEGQENAVNSVIIKDNQIYAHKQARFYYTTCDVRRSEDIINPRTSHKDIMLLASHPNEETQTGTSKSSEQPPHQFLYACVLGIYHTNVVYTGPGMISYEPMRFDFLWVRWFNVSLDTTYSKKRLKRMHLDCLTFPQWPTTKLLILSILILFFVAVIFLPMFSQGRRLKDGVGLSKLARDEQDWKYYFVHR